MAAGDTSPVARATAIVSALGGTATIATVTGGAVTWARFHAAQLPADQIVAATPNTQLVTVGAVAIASYGAIGALAVLAAFLIDSKAKAERRIQASIFLLALSGVGAAIYFSEPSTAELWKAVPLAIVGGAVTWLTVHLVLAGGHPSGTRTEEQQAKERARRRSAATAALVVMLGLTGAGLWWATGEDWVGIMALVAGVLAAGLVDVARATGEEFRWFGVGVFLSVILFGAVMTTLRTASAAKLQSAAVLLDEQAGNRGTAALYVAETDDRIYLADVDHCVRKDLVLRPTDRPIGGTGRIIEVPRTSLRASSIGVSQRLRQAEQRGPQLLAELRQRFAAPAPSAGPSATDPCADEGVVDLTRRRPTPVPAGRAAELADRFRPVLKFDSTERWRPLNVETLLKERDHEGLPRHKVCLLAAGKLDAHQCEPLAGVADLSDDQSATEVIDFAGHELEGTDYGSPSLDACPGGRPQVAKDCDTGPAAAMYYRVTKSGRRTYVDYWWLLRFNDFDRQEAGRDIRRFCRHQLQRAVIGCFNHEGDWEGVTVVSARDDPEKLAFVDMASHEGVFRYAAAELQFQDRDRRTRVVVYPARGSHASYPRPCRKAQACVQTNSRLPETRSDGGAPWGANATCTTESGCLIALPDKGFNAFAGRWGSPVCVPKGCQFAAGPKSPSRQRRYTHPWCFTAPGPRLACDGAPPPVPKPAAASPPRPGAARPATRAAP